MTSLQAARERTIAAVMSGSVNPGTPGMSRKKAEEIVDALAEHQREIVRQMVAEAAMGALP